jgi:UDP-N-acetyl-D-glucosamine/UDP-N-acetyl-D-galactosamine dehydrogenase
VYYKSFAGTLISFKNKPGFIASMRKICVVGLGYVGLPLAVAFGLRQKVFGFDVDKKKVEALKSGLDQTGELSVEKLKAADIEFSSDPGIIYKADFVIIAVPTPITTAKVPDFYFIESASKVVGQNLKKGTVVVYESTVHPGATENICVPILEKESGLKCGKDFKVGYSPERINPGDKAHSVESIIKVVSGMDKETLEIVAETYSLIIKAGVYKASCIKVAEACKVIENIQRDLNIALMNELSMIFKRLGISTKEVLDAAGTKWNFHKYYPGLVGGHCIGVDPYYLAYDSQSHGYQPLMILAARNTNESMAKHVAELIMEGLCRNGKNLSKSKVLVMGLTYKENVKDSRNSKAKDVIEELKRFGIDVIGCEPMLGESEVSKHFGVKNVQLSDVKGIDCAVVLAPHDEFRKLSLADLKKKMNPQPVLFDIRNIYPDAKSAGFDHITL